MKVTLVQLAEYLKGVAIEGEPVYYIDVTEHFQLKRPDSNWRNHPLCNLFVQLDRNDTKAGRPLLTSMVIRKKDKIPGKGFFASLATKYKDIVPAGKKGMKKLHQAEMEATIQHYKGSRNSVS
jgi:hypothetical protein